MHADKRGRLLTQPPRKLPASVTQAMHECVITKNVCILWDGMTINIRVHVTPIFPTTLLCPVRHDHSPLTPRWPRDHCDCSFEISESVDRNQSTKNWIGLFYDQKILESKSCSHDDKLYCIRVYLAQPTRDMTSFKTKYVRISNEK